MTLISSKGKVIRFSLVILPKVTSSRINRIILDFSGHNMILLNSLSGKVVLFDQTSLSIFNQKDTYQKERLLLALFMMGFACLGIYLQPDFRADLFFFAWITLFFVWLVYFLLHFFRHSDPESLPYSEIQNVTIHFRKLRYEIKIYYSQNKRAVCLSTRILDEKLISFLKEQKIRVEN